MSEQFTRQSFLGADSERTLGKLSVAIVGYGGGGSHIGQQLAHVGVGRIIVIDPDIIEESNLNRLVGGTWQDVLEQTPKVEIARRTISAIRPTCEVVGVQQEWQFSTEALIDVHAVFGGIDSFAQRVALEAYTRRFLLPYIDIGMDVLAVGDSYSIVGQAVLSLPGAPCLRCMGVISDDALALEERARQYGEAGSKPQVIWPNGVLASTAVGLFMQLITPWQGSAVASAHLEYDGDRNTVRPAPRLTAILDRQLPCEHYHLNEAGDPFFELERPHDGLVS